MTKQQFDNTVKYLRVKLAVVDMRIHIDGSAALRKALDEQPELEAELILRETARNPDLYDMVKERAAIRWSNGYSDTLYMAVLCNIKPTGETTERDKDEQIILKPVTDENPEIAWRKELQKYKD